MSRGRPSGAAPPGRATRQPGIDQVDDVAEQAGGDGDDADADDRDLQRPLRHQVRYRRGVGQVHRQKQRGDQQQGGAEGRVEHLRAIARGVARAPLCPHVSAPAPPPSHRELPFSGVVLQRHAPMLPMWGVGE
ncbi:hypothetical protein [Microbacterium luticocti]|uniref:hypothetical protein n=1 Tax=Microbacterium luticocti TaxID=451764 RepID=UPI0012EC317A|nr:hypothetical protein [Microbacterium luticocti]